MVTNRSYLLAFAVSITLFAVVFSATTSTGPPSTTTAQPTTSKQPTTQPKTTPGPTHPSSTLSPEQGSYGPNIYWHVKHALCFQNCFNCLVTEVETLCQSEAAIACFDYHYQSAACSSRHLTNYILWQIMTGDNSLAYSLFEMLGFLMFLSLMWPFAMM